MDLALTGKRALVTGSTRGIGEGIAELLAREGAAVVVQGRNDSAGRRVQQEIEAAGGRAAVAIVFTVRYALLFNCFRQLWVRRSRVVACD